MTRFIPLHENVTLVGSGELGLSHYLDCHVYLLHSDQQYALIDAGSGVQPERITGNLRQALGDANLDYLLLTHCHGDHAGGVTAVRTGWSTKVASSEWEIQMLESGSDDDLGLTQARFAGTYPPDYSLAHTRGDLVLQHGAILTLGRLTIRALVIPGHTRGSVCYHVTTPTGALLFSGDTVFWGGLIQLLNTPGSEISGYRKACKSSPGLAWNACFRDMDCGR